MKKILILAILLITATQAHSQDCQVVVKKASISLDLINRTTQSEELFVQTKLLGEYKENSFSYLEYYATVSNSLNEANTYSVIVLKKECLITKVVLEHVD